jgi:hypothetical protein
MITIRDTWEKTIDSVEDKFPMAIYNWSPEDWKKYIRLLLVEIDNENMERIKQITDVLMEKNSSRENLDFRDGYEIALHDVIIELYKTKTS